MRKLLDGRLGVLVPHRPNAEEQSYPKPRQMFLRIGLTILAAVCVGVAADYLITALAR